jgi:uncharacterized phiE125 gp8 family phage protein
MKWVDIPSSAVLYSGPAAEPLTYAEAKLWLRLPDDTDQTLVTSLIAEARAKIEQDTGLKLITQSWDVYFDAFPEDAIFLPVEPLLSVTSLKVTSVTGVQSTVASTVYQVDTADSPPRILLADGQSWPTDIRTYQGIVARVSVGFGAASTAIPGPLINACRQLVTMWYTAARQGQGVLPPKWAGYDDAIAPYRRRGIA